MKVAPDAVDGAVFMGGISTAVGIELVDGGAGFRQPK